LTRLPSSPFTASASGCLLKTALRATPFLIRNW
jgi:hypothetical protein